MYMWGPKNSCMPWLCISIYVLGLTCIRRNFQVAQHMNINSRSVPYPLFTPSDWSNIHGFPGGHPLTLLTNLNVMYKIYTPAPHASQLLNVQQAGQGCTIAACARTGRENSCRGKIQCSSAGGQSSPELVNDVKTTAEIDKQVGPRH